MDLLCIKSFMKLNMFPLIPYFSNFSSSPCLHTMLNAFSRSTNMARTFFFSFFFREMSHLLHFVV